LKSSKTLNNYLGKKVAVKITLIRH